MKLTLHVASIGVHNGLFDQGEGVIRMLVQWSTGPWRRECAEEGTTVDTE